MNERKSWKKGAEDWLADMGYPYAELETDMDGRVELWWQYYRAEAPFYTSTQVDQQGRKVDVKVRSMTPAKMVCEDMASLVFNERASISFTEDVGAGSEWLESWLKATKFFDRAGHLIQRTFVLGTAGWALHLSNLQAIGNSPALSVLPQRYDARHIVPLDWDGEDCTACAFVSTVFIRGEELTQVELHRPNDAGSYEIAVRFFDEYGSTRLPDGYTDGVIDTKQPTPTFALTKTALDNPYADYSPFGVSLIDAAVDAIETVDLAFDNIGNEIFLGKKFVMMPASMMRKSEHGYIAPQVDGRQFFLALEDNTVYENGSPKVVEYNPELRADEGYKMLSLALQVLGKRVGFGTKYYSLDNSGHITTTAKEVASDNAEMMRTVQSHERIIRPAVETVVTAAANIYASLGGVRMPPNVGDALQVVMGDSIMQDEDSMRERDRLDVAAGLLERWQYMVRWQGYTEDDAKAFIEAETVPEV